MYYQFDHFLVDTNNLRIYSGDQLLSDDEKCIKLIALLCDKYPNVVEKDYLIEQIWNGQAVTDWSLSKLVSDLRKLLEPANSKANYIKTVRGSGFRFNAKVKISEQKPSDSERQNYSKQNKPSHFFKTGTIVSLLALLFVSAYIVSHFYQNPSQELKNSPSGPLRIAVLPVESDNTPINDWIKFGVMSMVTDQLNSYSSIQTIPSSTVISATESLSKEISIDDNFRQYFETLCGKVGCNKIVSIHYQINQSGSPELYYTIYDEQQQSSVTNFKSNDIIYATAQLLDSLARDLLPTRSNRISLSDTYSSDTKANRDYAIGVNELLSGDPVSAISYLKIALERKPDFFWANARLAEAHYQNGQLKLASDLVAKLKQQNPSAKRNYFLEHLESNILYSQGNLEKSLALSLELQNNSFALENPLLLGNELLNIGSSYQASGELTLAEQYLNKSIQQYQLARYKSGEAKAFFNLGNVYLSMSEDQKAIDYYQKALEVFIQTGMHGFALMAKHQIATTNILLKNYQHAETELLKLVEDYKNINSLEGELMTYVDLISIKTIQKDYVAADKIIQQVLPQLEKTEFFYLIGHAQSMAVVTHLNLNNIEKAEKYFNQINGQWRDNRPAFAFIEAHLTLAKGDINGALKIAESIKKELKETWTPAHQKVLDQFKQAQRLNKVIPILY